MFEEYAKQFQISSSGSSQGHGVLNFSNRKSAGLLEFIVPRLKLELMKEWS